MKIQNLNIAIMFFALFPILCNANAYPLFVEQDLTILCGKYAGIKQYKNQNIKVTCNGIRDGYMNVYAALQRPLFYDLAGVLDAFKKNTFQDIMKKDISKCNRVNSKHYNCSVGDMRWIFTLNSRDQVLQTVVKMSTNTDTFKQMLGSGSRPNQQNETAEYKDLIYDTISKASKKVDGKYIRTEYYNGELILTFLNKDFN